MKKILTALRYILIYLIFIIIALIVLYPIAFAISGAFNKGKSLASMNILPIPNNPTTENFTRLFTTTNYLSWYKNSLTIACLNSVCTTFIVLITAYVFSRFRFRLKKAALMSFLILNMFPNAIGMVAIYVVLSRLGLSDNFLGLVLVYCAGNIPYNTWLLKGYLDTIPRSIDEAARVDGSGHLSTFFRIILPNTLPMIAFLAVTSFTQPWMDFILPRFILRSDKNKTLAVGLFEMINGRSNDNFTMFAAGALLIAVPFVILFVINQKYLVKIMSTGAVKE
ncbi:MAG: sugar ABC transporter permease [Clostridiaceae bacterium]|nr:sugar ABC transporter permease [Clostridiaceae bacterium]